MKSVLLAALATLLLAGCIFDDEFWDDYDSTYDSPAGEDCDCDDGEEFSLIARPTEIFMLENHRAPD